MQKIKKKLVTVIVIAVIFTLAIASGIFLSWYIYFTGEIQERDEIIQNLEQKVMELELRILSYE